MNTPDKAKLHISSVQQPKENPGAQATGAKFAIDGEGYLPVGRALVGIGVDQKINEGTDLGLGEPPRRVDRINALGFDRKFGDHIFDQTVHGAGEEDLVNSGLEETMIYAYNEIREERKKHDVDLRTAAFISSINKVAKSYLEMGIFPCFGCRLAGLSGYRYGWVKPVPWNEASSPTCQPSFPT